MQLTKPTGGLNGFQIKLLALVLMVLDHIHYFFSFTGMVPTALSMLGRLSAPLFLFIVVEGYSHTRSRKKYFLRCWAIGAAMGAVNYAIAVFGLARGDGFVPQNNIFATIALLIVLWQGMDWLRARRWLPGVLALTVPFALFGVLLNLPPAAMPWGFLAECTVLPLPFLTEGGTAVPDRRAFPVPAEKPTRPPDPLLCRRVCNLERLRGVGHGGRCVDDASYRELRVAGRLRGDHHALL